MNGSFIMRAACSRCGSSYGAIETKSCQDVVYCSECRAYQYNAPKTETGRRARSTSTTHAAISPKQRYRILERANGRCEICGKTPPANDLHGLHVGHVISVKIGHDSGMSDAEINDDENLICQCAECNLAMSSKPLPIRFYLSIIRARLIGGGNG